MINMFVAVDENYFSKIFEGEERLSNVTNRLSSVGIEKKKKKGITKRGKGRKRVI